MHVFVSVCWVEGVVVRALGCFKKNWSRDEKSGLVLSLRVQSPGSKNVKSLELKV